RQRPWTCSQTCSRTCWTSDPRRWSEGCADVEGDGAYGNSLAGDVDASAPAHALEVAQPHPGETHGLVLTREELLGLPRQVPRRCIEEELIGLHATSSRT